MAFSKRIKLKILYSDVPFKKKREKLNKLKQIIMVLNKNQTQTEVTETKNISTYQFQYGGEQRRIKNPSENSKSKLSHIKKQTLYATF